MSFGLTVDGFAQMTLDDLKTDIENALKAEFGDSIDLTPQSPFGILTGVMAERFADLWALGGALDAAFTPDGATGTFLDNLCGITGTMRLPATYSTVTVTVSGTPGTVLAAGKVVSVATIGTRFVLAGGTIGGGGTVDLLATAEQTGPKIAAAGTLTVIATPVAGWASVTNALDATPGTNIETDAALRIRREVAIRASGLASLDSIRAAVLAVTGVTACSVFENTTEITDTDGLAPHSIEALVQGGDDTAVLEALFASVAAGIATNGTSTAQVADSEGGLHWMAFSRPSEEDVWVIVNATIDTSLYPSDGDAQVKQAIIDWGDQQKAGKDVVAAGVSAQVFKIPGVLDAEVLIGLSDPPTLSATLPMSLRQIATYDTSRVAVNATPGTP